MKVVLLLLVVGVAVWYGLPRFDAEERQISPSPQVQPRAQTVAEKSYSPEPRVPVAPARPKVTEGQLVILRGEVLGQEAGMLLVDCSADPEGPQLHFTGANVGASQVEAAARWQGRVNEAEIVKVYGPLQRLAGGALRTVEAGELDRVMGRVLLAGFPRRPASVHVVAAPTGESIGGVPVYSADFQSTAR